MASEARAGRDLTAAERLGETSIFQVIAASSVGTMIEWYDFYIFGSLAAVMSRCMFFPKGNPDCALLSDAGDLRGRLRRAAVRRARLRPRSAT